MPGRPKEAVRFLTRAETETVDRRLRTLIRSAFVAIESDEESQPEAAGRWLDRALSLIENRKRVRAGLSGHSAEEIEAQLRQRGFVAIVYTPKEILEIVEDFNIAKFDVIEWLEQDRGALE